MQYEEYILEQLESFLLTDEIPQSIAIFNITNAKAKELYLNIKSTFDKIKEKATNQIQQEFEKKEKDYDEWLNSELEKKQEIENKYKSLELRYKDRPELKEEFLQWQEDECSPYTKKIESIYGWINEIPNEVQREIEGYELLDFDVMEFYKARERIGYLMETYSLSRRYERRRRIKSQYGQQLAETEEEKEHMRLHKYQVRRLFHKYAFVYNINKTSTEDLSLDQLMDYVAGKDVLGKKKWNIVCFAPDDAWFKHAPEELKEIINTKYKIFL